LAPQDANLHLDRADAATKDLRRKAPACIFMHAKDPDYHPTLPSDHTSARTGVRLLLSHGIFVIVGSSDFENVKQSGCRSVVRLVLLWASTGVKDKSFPDTRYVVELVAPDTVNTMPEATLHAVADHGEGRGDTIRGGLRGGARRHGRSAPRWCGCG
jgi:hypothetical protein